MMVFIPPSWPEPDPASDSFHVRNTYPRSDSFHIGRGYASPPPNIPVIICRVASRSPGMSYKQERQFGFLFTFVFALVAFWPLWPLPAPNLYWLSGAGAWLAAALIYPKMLAPLYKAGMAV